MATDSDREVAGNVLFMGIRIVVAREPINGKFPWAVLPAGNDRRKQLMAMGFPDGAYSAGHADSIEEAKSKAFAEAPRHLRGLAANLERQIIGAVNQVPS